MRFFAAALFAAVASVTLPAQPHHTAHHDKEDLKFAVILSRHGIRPPLQSNTVLAPFAVEPWPAWEVGLGQLTPHGAETMKLMGAYLRHHYASLHLLPAHGCDTTHHLFLYSDVDQRDMATDRALDEGMFPHCTHTPIFAVDMKTAKDPLFARALLPAQSPNAAVGSFRQRFPEPEAITTRFQPALDRMAHALAPDPLHPAAQSILAVKAGIVRGSGEPGATPASLQGPVFTATRMAEDFFLEYLNNKPMNDVAWGRLDDEGLREARALHAFAFRASYGDGYLGRSQNSNLLSHILDLVQQAALAPPHPALEVLGDGPMSVNALAPATAKLVILAGHDDNLAAFGGVFGVHWHADAVDDETPPGAELVIELWQDRHIHAGQSGARTVRLLYRAASAADQRHLAHFTDHHHPEELHLKLPHCAEACPLADFLMQARAALDPYFVIPQLAPAFAQEPPPAAPPAAAPPVP